MKLYFMFIQSIKNYGSISLNDPNSNTGLLYLLFSSFNPFNDWVIVACEEDNHNIITFRMQFPGDTEDEYGPDGILRMSRDNYNYIINKWNKVIEQKPKYFILSRDDNGWIDLELKNELSDEDQQYLDQDKIKKIQGPIIEY